MLHFRYLGALLLLSLLAACGGEDVSQTEEGTLVLGEADVEQTLTRGVMLGGRTLVLDGFSGRVNLEGTATDVARLTFVKRARGQDDEAARERLETITLEESGQGDVYRYIMHAEEAAQSAVDVRGQVPRSTPLRIQLENGKVDLDGVAGSIEAEATSGPIQIADAEAGVTVTSRNSTIDVGHARVPANSTTELETSNGDLTLRLPADASAQVEAHTNAGDINVQGLSFDSRQLEPEGAGATFSGTIGGGNATIALRTENGAITLRRRQQQTTSPVPDTLGQPRATSPSRSPRPLDTTSNR